MNAPLRLITFDLDDTLWDVRPALQAAERAQWLFLRGRFPSLGLDTTPRDQLDAIRRSVLEKEPKLAHHISLFREQFIDALLHEHHLAHHCCHFTGNNCQGMLRVKHGKQQHPPWPGFKARPS